MSEYLDRLIEKLIIREELWTWKEAVRLLELTRMEQLLLCALWNEFDSCEMSRDEFFEVYTLILADNLEEVSGVPMWIYESEDKVVLSPVLEGWLNGELPKLPKGAELHLTNQKKSYGLDEIFKDADAIFHAVEESDEKSILCIEGERGSGRRFCMEQILAKQGLALLVLDGDVFVGSERELNACMLCARLYEAFVCVSLGKEIREKLMTDLSDCFRFFGIIKEDKREFIEQPQAVTFTRKLTRPGRSLKEEMIRDILGDLTKQLPENISLSQLTGRQLPMGMFLQYITNIRGEIEAGTIRAEHVQVPSASTSLNLLPATRTFEELKLPKVQYEQLRRISKMIAARESVMSNWGFGSKFTYGNGLSVLFYGAPGTGKTMAAQVLANELGMPLYRVDLSQLISKYIGETQKNIGKIFDEAEKCDCILLFDEADAIFTKRSDVSDAQDRYSNAETAYLLQRIEAYAGVSILATNLLQNFDEAFRRRISYMVHFPMPDVKLRKELWETIFPKETPISMEVDALTLAQAFELSGASIKNAALHSALLANAEESDVRMCHILDGIRNEYGKQGKSFSSTQKELLDAYV